MLNKPISGPKISIRRDGMKFDFESVELHSCFSQYSLNQLAACHMLSLDRVEEDRVDSKCIMGNIVIFI